MLCKVLADYTVLRVRVQAGERKVNVPVIDGMIDLPDHLVPLYVRTNLVSVGTDAPATPVAPRVIKRRRKRNVKLKE